MAYPTLANLNDFLGLADATLQADTPADWMVDATIDMVERWTGRTFVVGSDTELSFPVESPYVSKDRRRLLFFRDVATVTTVTNGDSTVVSSSDYRLLGTYGSLPYYGIELKKSYAYRWMYGSSFAEPTITGKWGYSVSCPEDLFDLMLRIMAWMYRSRQTGQSSSVSVGSRKGNLVLPASDIPKDLLQRLKVYKR